MRENTKFKQATTWLGFLCLTRIAYFGINHATLLLSKQKEITVSKHLIHHLDSAYLLQLDDSKG